MRKYKRRAGNPQPRAVGSRGELLPHILRRSLLSWLAGTLIAYLCLPPEARELSGTESFGLLSPLRVLWMVGVVFGVLTILSLHYSVEKWEKWGIFSEFCLLSGAVLRASFRWAFLGALVLCLGILLGYCLKGRRETERLLFPRENTGKGAGIFLTVLSIFFFLFVSLWTVARVYSFSAPTYDFGIFSQMFWSMKEKGTPITTLEREGALSHFAVHVSPIYYLLLPFYVLAPYPATLQILQGGVMVSAVVPLWKLGDFYGFKSWQKALLCTVLLLYPAFSGGAGYDLHENCFLTPLLLWLLYGIEKKNGVLTWGAALLTLCVKEDGAVYVGVIALWLLLSRVLSKEKGKDLATALGLLVTSLLWFLAVTTYLKYRGDGVMAGRYGNFMGKDRDSLLWVVVSVFVHPMKVLYECTDPEKLKYVGLTMGLLLGLPLWTRRYERYVLLIPYILVNLMSDYQYQHEIFFQYSFGSTALLLYLTLVNLADLRKCRNRTGLLSAVTIACGIAFALVIVPKAMTYPRVWSRQREELGQVRQTLSLIPREATVTANTFYTVALSQREKIYDLGYAFREQLLESQYVVVHPGKDLARSSYATAGREDSPKTLLDLLQEEGYEEVAAVGNRLTVYERTPPP